MPVPAPSVGRRDVVHLTNAQSIRVHGWFNPKRTLTWLDIVNTPHMNVQHLFRAGLSSTQLKQLQPSIAEWITHRHASFGDVPYMLDWPLHPIRDLKGNLAVIVEHKYDVKTLLKLGLGYNVLKQMGLTCEWMNMMEFSLRDWLDLGMTSTDANQMSDGEIAKLFGTDRNNLALVIAMAENAMMIERFC